ncbi:MAG: IS3 family transposase, partial [Candidatus Eisenbacteria bacterium]|nr:IS3 family transposase [Candidatus Eisenbacteria bacterium]
TLECELIDRRRFRNQAEARMAIFDFIEGWYNPHRRHSGIEYESPVNYEKRLGSQTTRKNQKNDFHTGSESHDLSPA